MEPIAVCLYFYFIKRNKILYYLVLWHRFLLGIDSAVTITTATVVTTGLGMGIVTGVGKPFWRVHCLQGLQRQGRLLCARRVRLPIRLCWRVLRRGGRGQRGRQAWKAWNNREHATDTPADREVANETAPDAELPAVATPAEP